MVKLLSIALVTVAAVAANAEQYALQFFIDPVPGWNKNRLKGEQLTDNSGFRVFDMTPDAEPFNDAESFKVDAPLILPYGKKQISIRVEVGAESKPLWGNRLMQFQLNGAELDAALDEKGLPVFEKEYGDDGKGFVPAQSGVYVFEIDKNLTDLQFLSFMTAGTERFDMTVNDVVVDVWPEEDLRPRPYLLRFNRLGYLTDQPQPMILEWQNDLAAESLPLTIRQANHGERLETLTRMATSSDVGLSITPVQLNLTEADYNTLIIPETVKRTKHTSALFRTRDDIDEYRKARDQALGAFHWFDMRTYEGAHMQDKRATIFGTSATKDVYGGWYDAGDYGRYSVTGAWSVYVMLLSYLANEDAFPSEISPLNRNDEQRPAFLDLLVPELEFLTKMQRADGAVYHKVTARDWPSLTLAPVDDVDEKFIMPFSTTATADVAAVMNLAAYVFSQSGLEGDVELAKRYRAVAEKANAFLADNPDRIMIQDRYDGAEYGGPYTDENDQDERLLAAISEAWFGQPIDQTHKDAVLAAAKAERFGDATPDWMHVNFLSVFSVLMQPETDPELQAALLAQVENSCAKLLAKQQANPYGLMYAGEGDQFNWGSNGIVATLGTQLMWLHTITEDERYWQSAYQMSHWFFGVNPHGLIFATGPTRHHVQRPHFRPLVSQAAPEPYGLLSGGPNSVELKGDTAAAPLFKKAPMQVYIDDQDSWATNEVAINWQAAWASYLTLLTAP